MAFVSMDIEPYEYVRNCSKREIKELIEELIEEGHLPEGTEIKPKNESVDQTEWEMACSKLIRGKHLLSCQDEMTIMNISQKII
jgi:hypothetical protein